MKSTTAREHLEEVLNCIGVDDLRKPLAREAIHAARNFLQVSAAPTGTSMEPFTQFQRELCMNMVKAAHSQGLDVTKAKGVKLQRFYVENLRGAANALTVLQSDQLNGLTWLFVMVCTRGAEVVHKMAEGKPIP